MKGKWIDEIDYNVLFNPQEDFPWRFVPRGGQEVPGDAWQDWQALGYDRHSIRSDPLFVDPARGDYRVQNNSPARRIGFENFPMHTFGLREDYRNRWQQRSVRSPDHGPSLR